jgi:hypothetical protein
MKIKNGEEFNEFFNNNFTGIVEWSDGVKQYKGVSDLSVYTISYIENGKYHNENGPAIVYLDGVKAWYLNGRNLSEQYWEEKVKELKRSRLIPK